MPRFSIRTTGTIRVAIAAKAVRFQIRDWENMTLVEFLRRCAS